MGLGAMTQLFSLAFRHRKSGWISFENKKELLLNQQSVVKGNNQLKIMFGRPLTTASKAFTKQGAGVQTQWKA